jgi:hypothetical protein
MTAPNYPIDFLFEAYLVFEEVECFFCTEIITSSDDVVLHITIPGKNDVAKVHAPCFEQLAWSMIKYVMDNNGKLVPERVLN